MSSLEAKIDMERKRHEGRRDTAEREMKRLRDRSQRELYRLKEVNTAQEPKGPGPRRSAQQPGYGLKFIWPAPVLS